MPTWMKNMEKIKAMDQTRVIRMLNSKLKETTPYSVMLKQV
jgi:hypothetical protein